MIKPSGETTIGRLRSPAEQEVVDKVARSRGREWAELHADLIIEQAKHIGDLDENGD